MVGSIVTGPLKKNSVLAKYEHVNEDDMPDLPEIETIEQNYKNSISQVSQVDESSLLYKDNESIHVSIN